MKRLVLTFVLFAIFFCRPVFADDYINEQSDVAGVGEMKKFYSEGTEEYLNEFGISFDLEDMIDSIYSGEFKLSFSGILNSAAEFFFGNIKKNISTALTVLVLTVLSGFSSNVNMLGKNGGNAAVYVIFCVICGICAAVFSHTVSRGAAAIGMMSDFVKVTAPVMTTLCAVGGQAGYASVLSPLLYGASAVAINAVSGFVVPLSYGAFSLGAVSCISGDVKLSRGIKFMHSVSKWLMTFLLTVFSGVSVICSAAGSAMNAFAGRTVKFAVGNFIPFVGGMLADSIDMVAACTGIVKRAVGAGGMCVIMLVFLSCAIELAVQIILLRLVGAFGALVCDERIVRLLDTTADCISIIFAALCMTAFLFLVIITIMICGVSM